MKKRPPISRLVVTWTWGLAAGLLSAFLFVGCASSPESQQAEKDSDERESIAKEVKEEREVGRQMAAKLIGTVGLFEAAPKATQYLNLVGQTVANRSGRPEIDYRFAILKSDEANAYATPGGYVFVTVGLLLQLKSN